MKEMSVKQAIELARKYHEQGSLDQAQKIYEAVLALDSHHPEATHNLGMIMAARGEAAKAIEMLKKSLELDRNNPNFHNNLGELYRLTGQIEHALFHLSAACELKPGFSEAFSNLGIIHMEKGDIDKAKYCFSEALASNPSNIAALINTGNLFTKTGHFEDAMQCYEAVLNMSPDNHTALICAGRVHLLTGEYNTAAKFYSRAVNAKPDMHTAKMTLAEITLRNKDFRKGFQLYETRFLLHSILQGDRDSLWRGTGHENKTLYIYQENTPISGDGQTIMALRYIHELERFSPGKVLLYLMPEMAELFTGNMPDFVEIITEPAESFDKHIPLMSLPMVLNARAKTIPATGGYLKTEKKESGTKTGSALYSAKPEWAVDVSALQGLTDVTDLSAGSLKEKAEIIAGLNILITADNDAAHIAGALGVKTCLLLSHNHHWHWFNAKNGKTSEWYDSVTFYVKEKGADWQSVISSINIQK